MAKRYDRAYFDQWYRQRGIGGARRLARKVALAVATAEYHLERPIRTVLDIGCGEGGWFTERRKRRPVRPPPRHRQRQPTEPRRGRVAGRACETACGPQPLVRTL